MEKRVYWILGAGRFGRLAGERLLARRRPPYLVVVDRDREKLRAFPAEQVQLVHQDIVDFLLANLEREPDWVIPAAPIHVAFAWLLKALSERGGVEVLPVPEAVDAQVPNPWRDGKGGLYASVAHFRCPDDCGEPRDRCTATGLPRAGDLFSLLAKVQVPGYVPLVVRSHQLAPGVGGYGPSALRRLKTRAVAAASPILVATACRCHGVIHACRRHWAESMGRPGDAETR
jgi:hypothetical protein